jgi:hypothetical protein
MTGLPENYIYDVDDFVAYYFADSYRIGMDDEHMTPVAVAISVIDMADATGEPDATESLVEVQIVPTRLHDKALRTVRVSIGIDVPSDDIACVVEAARDYGYAANITEQAEGITLAGQSVTIADLTQASDNDRAREWIREHGKALADGCMTLAGFFLDQPQNMIGETGWDWTLAHVFDDYASDTAWPRP